VSATDVWLTPPYILDALGPFDLDPCSPVGRPWDTAAKHYTIEDDGLAQEWAGRVWLNPPYGPKMGLWLDRLAKHSGGGPPLYLRGLKRARSLKRYGAAPTRSCFYGAASSSTRPTGRLADPLGPPRSLLPTANKKKKH
jgi:hypothetical protein